MITAISTISDDYIDWFVSPGKTKSKSILDDGACFTFKGRISTGNLTLFDLADGKGHVQTHGSAVSNAFKISNISKGMAMSAVSVI
jgi:hypothetical protein